MSKRWLFWIVTTAVLVHLGVFLAVAHMRPLPKRKFIPRPTFNAQEKQFVDPDTGENLVVREYTVSTKLAISPPESRPVPGPVALSAPAIPPAPDVP